MSFINLNDQGTVYAPGYFLAHEECVRETREMAQNSTLVQTAADGAKYIPMGTAYPTNDGNAIGIVYEDVDVTTGNMPGSVVTKGVVIEDRLAITGASYDAVTLKDLVSPKAQGWQERSGSSPNYVYTLSTDTEGDKTKTYYEKSDVRLASAAKSALEGLGFTFVTEPAVTRPY